MLKVRRIYDKPCPDDGFRILVDRLWPRGKSKETTRVDLWLKDIAPSNELRKWFAHAGEKWEEFKRKYHEELAHKKDLTSVIVEKSVEGDVTLLYAAKDEIFNNAMALKEYIEEREWR